MYVLGINLSHNSTACLLKDGEIISCVSEERFTRKKNILCYPKISVDYVLNKEGITIKDVDLVVTTDDLYYPPNTQLFLSDKWNKIIIGKKKGIKRWKGLLGLYSPKTFKTLASIKNRTRKFLTGKDRNYDRRKVRELIRYHLGNEVDKKLILGNHHEFHALSSCFNINRKEPWLMITLDGEGAWLSGSVSTYKEGKLKVLSTIPNYDSLGEFYSLVTHMLGMKMAQHEFKVMGLAPYAKEPGRDRVYETLKPYFGIDKKKLTIYTKFITLHSTYELYRKKFIIENNERFDNIAAGVQKLLEELVLEWIRIIIKKTGVHNVALGGGVFLNVKLNQRISELDEVKKIFIMPSCGDESLAIGACYQGYQIYCKKNNLPFNPKPITHLYLGPEYNDDYVEELIKTKDLKRKYLVSKPKNINKEVAKLLAKGEIVARCSGNSEWGARALGNRSILANPKHPETIRVLNETIKDRDFWMPFTPSMLDKYEKKYLINPKGIKAPYMIITFNSTKKAQEDLPAALHPHDFTVRPQIVYKEWNPDYYEIIEEFSKITGKGAVLNTSFNLHGEPNVLTPEDALHTVENSALNYLAMGSYLLKKK